MMNEIEQEEREPTPRHLRIGIMGVIGAGKSTLALLLAERWGVTPISERYQDNRYLPLFYNDPKEWGFRSQRFFLRNKVLQLARIEGGFTEIIDPAVEMDTLYALTIHKMGWMTERQWLRYKNLYRVWTKTREISEPDIFVVARAPIETLLPRIEERMKQDPQRVFEKWILNGHQDYLEQLVMTLDEWVVRVRGRVPVIEISSETYNPISNSDDRGIVVGRIEEAIAQQLAQFPRGTSGEPLIAPSIPTPPDMVTPARD